MQIVNKLEMFHVAATDMDKTKEFYADTLGLVVTDDKKYGDQHWMSMKLPGGGASLNFTNVHENMQPGTLKLYFSSPDVEAAYNELVTKGIKPAKELANDWGKWNGSKDETGQWFELSDPDGNRLLIIPAEA